MSTETKVGAFVFLGLALFAVGIFMLGDFTFEKRYPLYVNFHDVGGLAEAAPVKLSGVEVGKVKAIRLHGDKAQVALSIREGVPVYSNSAFNIGSTGVIGSKFLEIDQGHAGAGVLQRGAIVEGVEPVSIEKALTKAFGSIQDLLGGFNGEEGKQGALAKNLNATISNVRNLSANLDEMIADSKPRVTSALEGMDSITKKLDSVLAKVDEMMAAINGAKGPVGALMHDEKMKNDVKETVASLKETANTAKDVFGRINQFRVYWNYDWRYEHAIRTSRGDIGLRIYPNENRYYYLGGSNLANVNDAARHSVDYARKNTVDALLGWNFKGWDIAAGVIRSAGGARVQWTPVPDHPILGRFSVMAQGFDFGRNRVMEGRSFTHPEYDFGAMVRLHPRVGLGGRVEDVQEVKRYQTWVNVNFEDKDIAYLLGLATFGAAGTKGRSKH